MRVTTLATGGPGSLSAALLAAGPRIIVFEVGGVIDLQGARVQVTQPFVTIAGQTAPSPGITHHPRRHHHQHPRRDHAAHPGPAGRGRAREDERLGGRLDLYLPRPTTSSSITAPPRWGTDENLSASGERFQGATADDWRNGTSHVVTFSNNIVAEGLANSTHSEGEHSKGGLIHDNVTKIALIGNLYFSNNERHPLFKGGARGIDRQQLRREPGTLGHAVQPQRQRMDGAPVRGRVDVDRRQRLPGRAEHTGRRALAARTGRRPAAGLHGGQHRQDR